MSPVERNITPTFVENEKDTVSRWSGNFGDRINELVFIGFDLYKNEMKTELDNCFGSDEDYMFYKYGVTHGDQWPIYEKENEH
jgi:hypothetical protein